MNEREYFNITNAFKEKAEKEYNERLKKTFELCKELSNEQDIYGVTISCGGPRIRILAFYEEANPNIKLLDYDDYKIEVITCSYNQFLYDIDSKKIKDPILFLELYNSSIYFETNGYISNLKKIINKNKAITRAREKK